MFLAGVLFYYASSVLFLMIIFVTDPEPISLPNSSLLLLQAGNLADDRITALLTERLISHQFIKSEKSARNILF